MKVVINSCYGGFSLSEKAYEFLGLEWDGFGSKFRSDEDRADPDLVKVVERLGREAGGRYSKLEVVEIPDDVDFEIGEYDGVEWVAEKHRTWP